jgi:small nuclear ribonucleoprotein G
MNSSINQMRVVYLIKNQSIDVIHLSMYYMNRLLTYCVVCLCFRYLDKQLSLKLNGRRVVTGVLRGFDSFMNVVLDDAREVVTNAHDSRAPPVTTEIGSCVIRGNSIMLIESLERINSIVH